MLYIGWPHSNLSSQQEWPCGSGSAAAAKTCWY